MTDIRLLAFRNASGTLLCASLSSRVAPQSPLRRGKPGNLQNVSLAPVTALLLGSSQISCKNLPWRQQDVNAGHVEL